MPAHPAHRGIGGGLHYLCRFLFKCEIQNMENVKSVTGIFHVEKHFRQEMSDDERCFFRGQILKVKSKIPRDTIECDSFRMF